MGLYLFMTFSNALPKTCLYLEFFWPAFSRIQTEYGDLLIKSPYSVRMRENTDQKSSERNTFHAVMLWWKFNCCTVWKVTIFGVFLVPVFSLSDWVRRDLYSEIRASVFLWLFIALLIITEISRQKVPFIWQIFKYVVE